MNIYKLWQDEVRGYDTYDSCVVIAEDEQKAKDLSIKELCSGDVWVRARKWTSNWTKIEAQFLGTSELPEQMVIASFNAG